MRADTPDLPIRSDEDSDKRDVLPLAPVSLPEREQTYHVDQVGWTPDKVRCAVSSAESGNLTSLADLVETMMADDRIEGVLGTRTLGLMGLPLYFDGGLEMASKHLEKEFDVMCPQSELVRLLEWGVMLGIGLAQIVEIPRRVGEPQRYRLEVWSPRWLSYDHHAHCYRVMTDGGQEYVDGSRWVLFTPYGESRAFMHGRWRSTAFPWLLKRFALEDRANYSETSGQPVKVGSSPQGSTETQRRSFRSQMAQLGRNGVLELPDGWDFKIEEAASTNWQIYTESVSWADRAISIALAGQSVSTEGSEGFSSGAVQDRIRVDFIRFDQKALGWHLREGILAVWAEANFGDASAAPLPFWIVEKPVDLSLQATAFETLGRAVMNINEALASTGATFEVDLPELARNYGLPLRARKEPLPLPVESNAPRGEGSSYPGFATIPTAKERGVGGDQ